MLATQSGPYPMKIRLFCLLLALTTLGGCTTDQASVLGTVLSGRGQYVTRAEDYLTRANELASPNKETMILRASHLLIQTGMTARAKQLLNSIDTTTLPDNLKVQAKLLRAQLHWQNKRPKAVLKSLNTIDDALALPFDSQIQYYTLRANAAAATQAPLASAHARIQLDHLLQTPEEKNANRRQLWQLLTRAPAEQLFERMDEETDQEIKGWFELAYNSKQMQDDPLLLAQTLKEWRTKYPEHPGTTLITAPPTKGFAKLWRKNTAPPAPISHVAVLLPLSGKLQKAGEAIRNGLMAGYYQTNTETPLQLKFYDTNQASSIQSTYNQALAEGADLILGPLNRDQVNALARKRRFEIPTLALNYLSEPRGAKTNFFQFGLSPIDETLQVVDRAWAAGHRHVLLLTPKGPWGEAIAKTFKHHWEQRGGLISGHFRYGAQKHFATGVKQLLHIDKSERRRAQLQKALGDKLKFIPRRRQDADMIYLVGTPKVARQLKPLIEYYYARNLAIYAPSTIYAGQHASKQDRDLDGIEFCDMPWLLATDTRLDTLRKEFQSRWADHYQKYTRLYALGLDAYLVATQMQRLQQFPAFGLNGVTGTLFLNEAQQIGRELQWAQFKSGVATPL